MNYYGNGNQNKTTVNGGVGVTGLLGVAFIVLKLLGVIDWSWWWVLCPFWGGLALVVIVFVVVFIVTIIKDSADERKRERRRRGK